MLTSSSGTNYVLNEHEDVEQYGPYMILFDIYIDTNSSIIDMDFLYQ